MRSWPSCPARGSGGRQTRSPSPAPSEPDVTAPALWAPRCPWRCRLCSRAGWWARPRPTWCPGRRPTCPWVPSSPGTSPCSPPTRCPSLPPASSPSPQPTPSLRPARPPLVKPSLGLETSRSVSPSRPVSPAPGVSSRGGGRSCQNQRVPVTGRRTRRTRCRPGTC